MSISHTTNIRTITFNDEILKVQATYGITVTNHSYFSVTGEAWDEHTSTDQDATYAGTIPDIISAAFPELVDIVVLHLCDAYTGVPLHARDNAWFWLKQGEITKAGKALRVHPERLAGITAQEQMDDLVKELEPEWERRAASARATYNLAM